MGNNLLLKLQRQNLDILLVKTLKHINLLHHRKHSEKCNSAHEVFKAEEVVKDMGNVDVGKEDIHDIVLAADDVQGDKQA